MKSIILIFALLSAGEAQFDIGGGAGSAPTGGGAAPTGGGAAPTGGGAAPSGGGFGGLPVPDIKAPALPALPIDICGPLKAAGIGIAEEVITGVCNMAKGWLKGFEGVSVTNPPKYRNILSEAQRKYWDSVVSCQDTQCICEYWPKCRHFVADLKSGKSTASKEEIIRVASRYGRVTRKEIRSMDDVERRRFFYALNKIKFDKIDGWSKYDILLGYHFFVPFTPVAHFSAGLLPFHRELLKNLEVALRFEHPLATFPYWDPTLDAEMNNPKDTLVFTAEYLGDGDGNVTSGPFATFTGQANPAFPAALYQGGIFRAFGLAQKAVLFNYAYVDIILAKPLLQMLIFCTDPMLDTIHAATHLYIGGLMLDPTTSPGDPLFYLLHCFIDSLWERWREKHQDRKQRESDYAIPCPYNPFDLPDMPLFPFNIKVKDGYSNIYTDEFYVYEAPPTCENNCHNSTGIVCNKKTNRCMSRVRKEGDCSGLDFDPCYKSTCKGGKCVA